MTKITRDFLDLKNFQNAWEKVAEKRGCAGVDGETISSFASNQTLNVYQLREAVAAGTYQPHPCKQVIIPKKDGGERELKIPTVRDRIVQQALLNVIYPIVEPQFSASSFAYRPHLSYLNAVEKIAQWRDLGYVWVWDADLVKFFDSIDRQRLLKAVRQYLDNPGMLCLIKSWLAVGVSTSDGLVFPRRGVPQGAVISPMLANIYLDEFDRFIDRSALKLVRYADDFAVLARSRAEIEMAVPEITNFLNKIGLSIHTEKTRITNFQTGFRFLGHGFLDNAIFPIDTKTVRLKSPQLNCCNGVSKKKDPKVKLLKQKQVELNRSR